MRKKSDKLKLICFDNIIVTYIRKPYQKHRPEEFQRNNKKRIFESKITIDKFV